jgi:hypothetical protein
MTRPVTAFSVLIDACWTSINNSTPSPQEKSEERLAGQSDKQHHTGNVKRHSSVWLRLCCSAGQPVWPAKSLNPQEAGETACPTRRQNYAALA